jgi:hypothetical protein
MEKLYKCVNGENVEYSEEDYAQAELDQQNHINDILPKEIRTKRNKLLSDSDWTQTLDSPLSAEQKQAWATYRQELRDITTQPGFPINAVFPTKP